MVAIAIHVGLSGEEPAAEVPRDQWKELIRTRRTHCNSQLRQDCRALVFFIEDAARNGWLGYADRESYVREGLGLDPTLVEWAVDGLKKLDGKHAVTFDEAVVLGGQGAPVGNDNAKKGRENKGNSRTFVSRGTSETYTLARLRRDDPDLAQAVERGELSANAAAIKAGFRQPTWTAPVDPERLAGALQRRYPEWEFRRRC